MKKSTALILFLFIFSFAWCQDFNRKNEAILETDLHQIRQIDGTNNHIIDFFNLTDVFFITDTAYCILIPPMKCSRCEGVINPFIYELKKAEPEALIIVMAFYPKTGALNKYLMERQFRADHTIASTDLSFLKNFYFSTDEMQVPYITKFNMGTGDLIIGKSTLGLEMNKGFVRWIRSFSEPMIKHVPVTAISEDQQLSVPEIEVNSLNFPVLKPEKEIVLGEEEGYPISRVQFPAFNQELSCFSFMDELSYKIYLYLISRAGMVFVEAIEPGEKEEKLFIHKSVNDTLYKLLQKMNIINTMYFSSTFIDDTIIVTSSLPFIFFEDTAMEELAYYNRSTYLYRSIEGDSIVRHIAPEYLPDTNYTFEHLNTQFVDQGKLICLPVSKGWPISGTEMLSEVEPEDNPFLPAFYKHKPIMAIYDNKGNFLHYFGNLPSEYEDHHLGYSYSRPMITSHQGMYWYADKFLGKIYGIRKLTQHKPSQTINVFDIPDYQSNTNQDLQPLKYIKDYKKVFTQSILDFKVFDDTVYVATRHEDFFFYKKYNTNGKLLSTHILPTVYDNMNASHFVFVVNSDHQWLIGIYESTELTSLYLFK